MEEDTWVANVIVIDPKIPRTASSSGPSSSMAQSVRPSHPLQHRQPPHTTPFLAYLHRCSPSRRRHPSCPLSDNKNIFLSIDKSKFTSQKNTKFIIHIRVHDLIPYACSEMSLEQINLISLYIRNVKLRWPAWISSFLNASSTGNYIAFTTSIVAYGIGHLHIWKARKLKATRITKKLQVQLIIL